MKRTTKRKIGNISVNVLLIVIGIIFLLPTLWIVLACFDRSAAVGIRIPETWTLENFTAILTNKSMITGFKNSLIIAVSVTLIVVVVSTMAAYPLSRYKTKWGNNVALGLLFLNALPASAMMISSYKLLVNLHLINSLIGVILLMATGLLPYGIWMTKNFMDTVSVDLEEAAWVDGASRAQAIIKVMVPLMIPGFVTVICYNFISAWGNFYTPFLMLTDSSKMPASVNIFLLYDVNGTVNYGQVAAYALLYTIPIFILYYFSQDHMSKGFGMSGATKG